MENWKASQQLVETKSNNGSIPSNRFKPLRRATAAPVTQGAQSLQQTIQTVMGQLDQFMAQFETAVSPDNVSALFQTLSTLRWQLSPTDWATVRDRVMKHPILKLVHQDPCTRRSYTKPRGYAGDAQLIDYLYRLNDDYSALSRVEKQLLDIVTGRPSAVAVRERLDIATGLIESVLLEKPSGKIVGLACGHFRELLPLAKRNVLDRATIVGIDQDAESLSTVLKSIPSPPLTLINASVTQLLKGRHFTETTNADLFYALGLFDYLSDGLAQSLVALMFSRLNPGGKVLVTNFTPKNPDIGYMETFMDWPLIVRESPEVYQFCQQLPHQELGEIKLYRGTNACIWYLEIEKR